MSSPSRFVARSVLRVAALACVLAACSSASPDDPGGDDGTGDDGGAGRDAQSAPRTNDAGERDGGVVDASDGGLRDGAVVDATAGDAGDLVDAGDIDATASDASDGAPRDASVDGAAPADGGGPDAATGTDGGPSSACAAVLADHLGSALVPPYHFAAFDLAASATQGGTTSIETLDPHDCYPPITETYAQEPGYRMHGASGVQLFSNLDTDAVYEISADSTFTGSLTFDTPPSSPYGAHHYVAKIGSLTKDGAPFAIDWNASAPAFQELYTGLMATFVPDAQAFPDCLGAGVCLENADRSVFGVRSPLYIYMIFDQGTSHPNEFYTVQTGAEPTCSTPKSIEEQWSYSIITPPELSGIGGLTLSDQLGDANLTPYAANAALCTSGTTGTTTGESQTLSWAGGRFVMTYDTEQFSLDYGYGTKLATGPGYKGFFYADTAVGQHEYDAGLGYFTYDGADLDLLAGGDAAITAFSNAVHSFWLDDGVASTDCLTDGFCTLTADAKLGTTSLALAQTGLTFVFSTATHEPVEIDETVKN